MKATCPVHGVQEFQRVEAAAWWWCIAGDWEDCKAVIPDELVTPDGADAVVWGEYRRLP